ncbi:hypothetical protein Tco_0032803 [Tanacetum coccineum]
MMSVTYGLSFHTDPCCRSCGEHVLSLEGITKDKVLVDGPWFVSGHELISLLLLPICAFRLVYCDVAGTSGESTDGTCQPSQFPISIKLGTYQELAAL